MNGHPFSEGQDITVTWKDHTEAAQLSMDALVVMVSQKDFEDNALSPSLAPIVQQLRDSRLFGAAFNQIHALPVPDSSGHRAVILVGIGERPLTSEELRLAAAQAAKTALKIQAHSLAWEVPMTMMRFTAEQNTITAAQALTEGFILGAYRIKQYKRNHPTYHGIKELVLFRKGNADPREAEEWRQGIVRGKAAAEATCLARDLTNLPGNMLVPEDLAKHAHRIARKHGMESHTLDVEEQKALGMGGLLSVGQGSIQPPRMIVMKYQGRDSWDDVIGLVGKGITFDTGGISLKKRLGMEEMISDMAGAAAVLGVMNALGTLKPKVNVVAVIPSAENMPGGGAFKPGDVIRSFSGRTIEVLNTDAEGRVVLADGMTYARQLGAVRLIDVATLTGAVVTALGDVATGAVTNDDTFLQELILASKRSGEKVWPLPAYKEFWDMLKSDVADIRNSTGGRGAAITAGLFIGTFAEGLPWVHLDIAGTAYAQKERGMNPKGGTGVMVRTLLEWILSQAESS